MLIIVGTILSIIASVLTYWGIGLFNLPWFYLFLLIPFAITFFVIFLNIYWAVVLISILPYRNKEFVGKVNKWNLFHICLTASFCLMLRGLIIKRKGFKKIPKQPSLILFNHISDYDPWVLYKLLHARLNQFYLWACNLNYLGCSNHNQFYQFFLNYLKINYFLYQ